MSEVTHAELQLRMIGAATWGTVKGGVWYPTTSSNPVAIDVFRLDLGNYLVVDTPYEWRVRVGVKYTFGGTSFYGWSEWSEIAQFTPVAVPVVSGVSMTAALLPTVSWSVTGTQSTYRVRILDDTGLPVYDSGVVVSTATSADVPQQDWVNGADYTPEVTVWSDFALQSDPATGAAVTISWIPPAAPTVSVQASARPMTVTANDVLATHHEVRCTWQAGGQTHSITLPAVEGAVMFEVPLAPYGVPTTFSVDASEMSGEAELWSDPSTGIGVTSDPSAYLVSDDGTSWLHVRVAEAGDPVDSAQVTIFGPPGALRPVKVSSPSQGFAVTTKLFVPTMAERDALRAWLDANQVFWFRWPPEWDDTYTYQDVPATRMATSAAWSEARLVNKPSQDRYVPLPMVEQ